MSKDWGIFCKHCPVKLFCKASSKEVRECPLLLRLHTLYSPRYEEGGVNMGIKCTDCGIPLEKIDLVRPVPKGSTRFDWLGHRDPLCDRCWRKAYERNMEDRKSFV